MHQEGEWGEGKGIKTLCDQWVEEGVIFVTSHSENVNFLIFARFHELFYNKSQ